MPLHFTASCTHQHPPTPFWPSSPTPLQCWMSRWWWAAAWASWRASRTMCGRRGVPQSPRLLTSQSQSGGRAQWVWRVLCNSGPASVQAVLLPRRRRQRAAVQQQVQLQARGQLSLPLRQHLTMVEWRRAGRMRPCQMQSRSPRASSGTTGPAAALAMTPSDACHCVASCNCLACGLAVAGVSRILMSSTEQSEQFGSSVGAKY